jgi:hypothetical protein
LRGAVEKERERKKEKKKEELPSPQHGKQTEKRYPKREK